MAEEVSSVRLDAFGVRGAQLPAILRAIVACGWFGIQTYLGGEAVLTVRDTGEGIPPEDLPRVFERFHRRADSGGSGLGLAIAKWIVEAHGGTITVRNSPGRGATFRVRLPAASGAAPSSAANTDWSCRP